MVTVTAFRIALIVAFLLFLPTSCIVPAVADSPSTPVTVYAPYPEQYDLVLNELELQLDAALMRQDGSEAQLALPPATAVTLREGTRVVLTVANAQTPSDLAAVADEIERLNPGTSAQVVLYSATAPRNKASRALLTREVGILLEPNNSLQLQTLLAGLRVADTRPVGVLPGAFVLTAVDPVAALTLAEALRQRAGVVHAYPLLRHRYGAR